MTLHPLSAANTWLRSHCNLVLQIGWIVAIVLASFSLYNTKIVEFSYKGETLLDCGHFQMPERELKIYVTTSVVLTFVLPMTFLSISYGAIGRHLLRSQKHWSTFNQATPFMLNSSVSQSNSSQSNTSNRSNSNTSSSNGSKERNKSSFVRNKPTRQSIKIKVSHSKSDISHKSNISWEHNGQQNPTKLMVEPNNHNKVSILFDKRNTVLRHKMKVSDETLNKFQK